MIVIISMDSTGQLRVLVPFDQPPESKGVCVICSGPLRSSDEPVFTWPMIAWGVSSGLSGQRSSEIEDDLFTGDVA